MLSGDETKIDIEKLIVWALRKQDYIFDTAFLNTEKKIVFTFGFIPEQEAPMSYNDIIGEFDTEIVDKIANDPDIELVLDEQRKLSGNKIMFRSPNNTMLFKHWVEENKIKKFTLQSFTAANVGITREQAVKIISHQIHKKTIVQLDNDTFKIVKEL